MSGKNQYPFQANWQSTSPVTGFKPTPAIWGGGSQPSGTLSGSMTGTAALYSNIFEVSRMDNIGLEFNWTGTPNGTFQVFGSISGSNFYDIGASLPAATGSASGFLLNLNQYPYKYFYIKYTNASSTGALTVFGQAKDLN